MAEIYATFLWISFATVCQYLPKEDDSANRTGARYDQTSPPPVLFYSDWNFYMELLP
jgi:hypothetical protein